MLNPILQKKFCFHILVEYKIDLLFKRISKNIRFSTIKNTFVVKFSSKIIIRWGYTKYLNKRLFSILFTYFEL